MVQQRRRLLTTRDEDPSDAVMARATAASQIALELDADNLIERTPENIGLLHDIVDTVHDMDGESDLGYYRAYPSKPPAKPSESISSMARSRRKPCTADGTPTGTGI